MDNDDDMKRALLMSEETFKQDEEIRKLYNLSKLYETNQNTETYLPLNQEEEDLREAIKLSNDLKYQMLETSAEYIDDEEEIKKAIEISKSETSTAVYTDHHKYAELYNSVQDYQGIMSQENRDVLTPLMMAVVEAKRSAVDENYDCLRHTNKMSTIYDTNKGIPLYHAYETYEFESPYKVTTITLFDFKENVIKSQSEFDATRNITFMFHVEDSIKMQIMYQNRKVYEYDTKDALGDISGFTPKDIENVINAYQYMIKRN
jgi:hypothetical protein